jgi:hypothetical protein
MAFLLLARMVRNPVVHVSQPLGTPPARWIASATTPLQMPLNEFRDFVVTREKRMQEPVGRSWTVKELRRKSYDDMHKLWYVDSCLLLTVCETFYQNTHAYATTHSYIPL